METSDKDNIHLSVVLIHPISANYEYVIFVTCLTYRFCVSIHKEKSLLRRQVRQCWTFINSTYS